MLSFRTDCDAEGAAGMPTNNQSGWDPKKPVRLEGFDRKQESTETPKESKDSPSARPLRARLEFPPAKPDPDPVLAAPPASETPRAAAPRVEAPRAEASRPAVNSSASRPKNTAYTPDPDPERVAQRQWWKYDLYKRSGRTDGGREAGEGRSI